MTGENISNEAILQNFGFASRLFAERLGQITEGELFSPEIEFAERAGDAYEQIDISINFVVKAMFDAIREKEKRVMDGIIIEEVTGALYGILDSIPEDVPDNSDSEPGDTTVEDKPESVLTDTRPKILVRVGPPKIRKNDIPRPNVRSAGRRREFTEATTRATYRIDARKEKRVREIIDDPSRLEFELIRILNSNHEFGRIPRKEIIVGLARTSEKEFVPEDIIKLIDENLSRVENEGIIVGLTYEEITAENKDTQYYRVNPNGPNKKG